MRDIVVRCEICDRSIKQHRKMDEQHACKAESPFKSRIRHARKRIKAGYRA